MEGKIADYLDGCAIDFTQEEQTSDEEVYLMAEQYKKDLKELDNG